MIWGASTCSIVTQNRMRESKGYCNKFPLIFTPAGWQCHERSAPTGKRKAEPNNSCHFVSFRLMIQAMCSLSKRFFLSLSFGAVGKCLGATAWVSVNDHGAVAGTNRIQTEAFQAAIEACAAQGGGTVEVPAGEYLVGGLVLRDKIHLYLAPDSILRGCSDPNDYGGANRWTDAIISADGVRDVRISGPGVIEGGNVERPGGEEGFRGPHAIFLAHTENARIEDLTIQNSGNYAILCRDVSGLTVERCRFLGGHDGLHIQACRDVAVAETDFRTGDDCVAGTDNQRVTFTRCYFNSACNAFRLGADGLIVRDSRFQGPGEFPHRVSLKRGGAPRFAMGAAFVHFAPKDRRPKLPSDNWLIESCVIDDVSRLYAYDFVKGLWQTGQPARKITFRNVQATRVAQPVRAVGDADRQFHLILDHVELSAVRDEQEDDTEVIGVQNFGTLEVRDSLLANKGKKPLVRATEGNTVIFSPSPAEDRLEIDAVDAVQAKQ